MKNSRKYSLVLFNHKGMLAVAAPDSRQEYYRMVGDIGNQKLIFAKYGLSEQDYLRALMDLHGVQYRNISQEVLKKVEGLTARLSQK